MLGVKIYKGEEHLIINFDSKIEAMISLNLHWAVY